MILMIDADGVLRTPNLHDGYLVGLELIDPEILAIKLRDLSGIAFTLRLHGLVHVAANDFRAGNIIGDLFINHGAGANISALERLIDSPHSSAAAEYYEKRKALISRLGDQVRAGELCLVELAPSYGCELVALSQSYQLERA